MFKLVLNIIIGMIMVNLIIYLLGAFVALSFNPLDWDIFKYASGRFSFIIFQIIILACVMNVIDELDL